MTRKREPSHAADGVEVVGPPANRWSIRIPSADSTPWQCASTRKALKVASLLGQRTRYCSPSEATVVPAENGVWKLHVAEQPPSTSNRAVYAAGAFGGQ